MNTELIQTTAPSSLVLLLLLPLTMGPTTSHLLPCELPTNYSSVNSSFEQKGIEKWKWGQSVMKIYK
jgi:hypothetical protein